MGQHQPTDSTEALLVEIARNQERLLAVAEESLRLQREGHEMAKAQYDRNLQLQERAEALQERSRALMNTGRNAMAVVIVIILLLLGYLLWMFL